MDDERRFLVGESGKLGAEWKRHFIADSYDTEGGWMADSTAMARPT